MTYPLPIFGNGYTFAVKERWCQTPTLLAMWTLTPAGMKNNDPWLYKVWDKNSRKLVAECLTIYGIEVYYNPRDTTKMFSYLNLSACVASGSPCSPHSNCNQSNIHLFTGQSHDNFYVENCYNLGETLRFLWNTEPVIFMFLCSMHIDGINWTYADIFDVEIGSRIIFLLSMNRDQTIKLMSQAFNHPVSCHEFNFIDRWLIFLLNTHEILTTFEAYTPMTNLLHTCIS